ncbi:hypothetical protein GH714_039545 [Hevea brasiliensis]|uniref:RRM domain-containing protein n=1 Tax=Hevea brasiliensis TaxID=3981 RepID=A0A6A6KER8_HEVBR|nr:hypothetical protein GH714_039545 [Hevea brasiliensis]
MKREDDETARLYAEFVESFQGDNTPGSKAFVRGGTINPNERVKTDSEGEKSKDGVSGPKKGSRYVPSFLPPPMAVKGKESEKKKEEERPKEKEKEKEKGKARNIDHFMEELKHEHEMRERRNQERERWRDGRATEIAAPSSRFDELPDDFDPTGKGSFDDGDPQTTNLYVGNLSPQVDENFLLRTFGRFGPIASVKIMWPRTEEERRRQRNCGFVAFMNRADGQAAKDEMQGVVVYEYELKIGWGKSVALPSQALPAPPPGHMAIRSKEGATVILSGPSGPPVTSVPNHNSELVLTPNVPDIMVVPPDDDHLHHVIDTMALYVWMEDVLLNKLSWKGAVGILFSTFCLSLARRNIHIMFGGCILLLRFLPFLDFLCFLEVFHTWALLPIHSTGCKMPRSVVVSQEAIRMDELEEKLRIIQEGIDEKIEHKMEEMREMIIDEMRIIMTGIFTNKGKGNVNEEVEGNAIQEGQGSKGTTKSKEASKGKSKRAKDAMAIGVLHNQHHIQVRYVAAVEYNLLVGLLNKQATEMEVEESFSSFVHVEDDYLMIDEGDTLQRWRTEPFIMITGSGRWMPPPLPTAKSPEHEKESGSTYAAGKSRRVDPERTLTDPQRDEFEDMLRALTLERSQIKDAMGFALDNADAAGEIVEVLTDSLTLKETPIPTKVARLMLVSDILHNSSAPVKNASAYRTKFEATLPDIMESFNDLYRSITGRITAEALKERVLKVLQVWSDWFLFSDAYVNGLRATFLRSSTSGVISFHSICGDAPEIEKKFNSEDIGDGGRSTKMLHWQWAKEPL